MQPALKFERNKKVHCALNYASPKEYPSKYGGLSYLYSCETIDGGQTAFFASKGLHRLIQAKKIQPRQEIVIEKVPNEKDNTEYFTINGNSIADISGDHNEPIHKQVEQVEEEIQTTTIEPAIEPAKEPPLSRDELDTLETCNSILLKVKKIDKNLVEIINHLKPSKDAEDLPF